MCFFFHSVAYSRAPTRQLFISLRSLMVTFQRMLPLGVCMAMVAMSYFPSVNSLMKRLRLVPSS